MSNDDGRDPELRALVEDVIEGRAPASNPPAYLVESELHKELEGVSAKIDERDAAEKAAEQAKQIEEAGARAALEAADLAEKANFKNATNEKGELLHPYFDQAEPAMIALAQSYLASGQSVPSLSELYETAVWANPSTRVALEVRQRVAEEATAKAAKKQKARSAEKNDEIAILLKKHGYFDGTHGKSIAYIARALEKDLNLPKMADPIRAISRRIERCYERQYGLDWRTCPTMSVATS